MNLVTNGQLVPKDLNYALDDSKFFTGNGFQLAQLLLAQLHRQRDSSFLS